MFRNKAEVLRGLDPTRPDSIQALIDFHRETFGGFSMMADDGKGGDAGGAGQGQDGSKPAGSDGTTGKPDDGKSGDGDKDGGDKPLGPNGEKALQAERDARKQIEKDLQDFKNAQAEQAKKLAEALRIKTEDTKPEDVVSELQKQIQGMQHQSLVYAVAAELKISDKDDLELIKAAADEATMRKLAARLAKKPDDDTGNGDGKPRRFPRQDPNQGRGGGNGNEGRPTSVAAVRAEREAARAAKSGARNA